MKKVRESTPIPSRFTPIKFCLGAGYLREINDIRGMDCN